MSNAWNVELQKAWRLSKLLMDFWRTDKVNFLEFKHKDKEVYSQDFDKQISYHSL